MDTHGADDDLWLVVRQALLLIVRAIEKKKGIKDKRCPTCKQQNGAGH